MKGRLFYISLLCFILCACGSNSKPGNQDQSPLVNQDATSEKETKGSDNLGHITLNNGQKWQADPDTADEIRYMKKILERFPANPTLQDYQTLKSQMVAEFGLIIQRSTMTDNAKGQLISYLTAMRKTMDKLSTTDLEVCRKAFAELKEQLDQYDKYFI